MPRLAVALSQWLLLISLLLAGCATAPAGKGGRQRDLLTREEILAVSVNNLYELIEQVRPNWLNVRNAARSFQLNTEIVVYQGQSLLGGPELLRQIAPREAYEIRYLDGPTATATLPGLGSRHVAAAIVIRTSPGR